MYYEIRFGLERLSSLVLFLLLKGQALPLCFLECGEFRLNQVPLLVEIARSVLVEGMLLVVDALLAETS